MRGGLTELMRGRQQAGRGWLAHGRRTVALVTLSLTLLASVGLAPAAAADQELAVRCSVQEFVLEVQPLGMWDCGGRGLELDPGAATASAW